MALRNSCIEGTKGKSCEQRGIESLNIGLSFLSLNKRY